MDPSAPELLGRVLVLELLAVHAPTLLLSVVAQNLKPAPKPRVDDKGLGIEASEIGFGDLPWRLRAAPRPLVQQERFLRSRRWFPHGATHDQIEAALFP